MTSINAFRPGSKMRSLADEPFHRTVSGNSVIGSDSLASVAITLPLASTGTFPVLVTIRLASYPLPLGNTIGDTEMEGLSRFTRLDIWRESARIDWATATLFVDSIN